MKFHPLPASLLLLCATLVGAQPLPIVQGQVSPGHQHSPVLDQVAATPGRAPWEPVPLLAPRSGWLTVAKRALSDPDPVLRRRALFVAGCLGAAEALAGIRPRLSDPDRLVRMQAAVAAAALGDASGLPGSAVALREGPAWLRLYALQALWRLDGPRGRQALKDSEPYLTPHLKACLRQALSSRPKPLRPPVIPPVPTPPSLYALWLEVADTFVLESDFWWHEGDYEQAIRCQQTTVFFDPTHVEAFTNVAWLQWSLGRHGEAIRTYHQALTANPQSWEAADSLAQYYLTRKQPSLALPYLQRAAELGSPPVRRRALGHVLEGQGRYEEAAQVWNDILEIDPNDPIARRQLERLQGK